MHKPAGSNKCTKQQASRLLIKRGLGLCFRVADSCLDFSQGRMGDWCLHWSPVGFQALNEKIHSGFRNTCHGYLLAGSK